MLLAVSGLAASMTPLVQAGKDKSTRDGTWVVVEMHQDGMKLPEDAVKKLSARLKLKGDTYEVEFEGKVVDRGTYKADESKKPITIDIFPKEGEYAGKKLLGIVEQMGDTMRACYDIQGKSRPTAFETKAGSGLVMVVYKRAK
jgi:uncharacterized protein (TIGR03067 family)